MTRFGANHLKNDNTRIFLVGIGRSPVCLLNARLSDVVDVGKSKRFTLTLSPIVPEDIFQDVHGLDIHVGSAYVGDPCNYDQYDQFLKMVCCLEVERRVVGLCEWGNASKPTAVEIDIVCMEMVT